MRKVAKGYVSEQDEKLLAMLLDQANASVKETALETLCSFYRKGFRLRNPHAFNQRSIALLEHSSPNVVKWALNALALIGTREEDLSPVLKAIQKNQADHDVMGAGIAALVRLVPPEEVLQFLKQIGVPFEGVALLAAAQHTNAFLVPLAKIRVKPDSDDGPALRLATVLVGLDKAPENLFEPKHSNAEIVGVLNDHDDALVAQYSVWAITENPKLSIENLKIKTADIERRPPNIRGWVFQLMASSPSYAARNMEYLSLGSEDTSQRARLGLATGLVKTFFDGLEGLPIDWFTTENDEQVRLAILDHMAENGTRCPPYAEIVKSQYRSAAPNSILRARLEARTSRTDLYGELRQISLQSESLELFGEDLFKREVTVINQNINGKNINIGNLAGRDIHVAGNTESHQENGAKLQAVLAELLSLIAEQRGQEFDQGRALIAEAQKSPTKSKIEGILSWLNIIKQGASYAAMTPAAIDKIHHVLSVLSSSF